MERKLTKVPASFVRCWGEKWQFWKAASIPADRTWQLAEEETFPPGPAAGRSICALPSRLVVAFSFWVKATDEEMVRSIAALEIEMKGLLSPERQAAQASMQILSTAAEETLVRALIFPSRVPAMLDLARIETFTAGPLACTLSDQAVHLWREAEDVVAVVIWKNHVLCWETISAASTTAEIERWLKCLLWQLRSDLRLAESFSLKDWDRVLDGPVSSLAPLSVTDDERAQGPTVQWESSVPRWQPAELRQVEAARREKQNLIRLGVAAVLVLVLAAAIPLILSWHIQHQIAGIDAEIARNETEATPLRAMAAKWSEIAPAVDDRYSPLAVLREIVVQMPPGLRLTSFAMSPQQISVEGQAAQVSAATTYLTALQGQHTDNIRWSMSPPALQPDNTAAFVISGSMTNDE